MSALKLIVNFKVKALPQIPLHKLEEKHTQKYTLKCNTSHKRMLELCSEKHGNLAIDSINIALSMEEAEVKKSN